MPGIAPAAAATGPSSASSDRGCCGHGAIQPVSCYPLQPDVVGLEHVEHGSSDRHWRPGERSGTGWLRFVGPQFQRTVQVGFKGVLGLHIGQVRLGDVPKRVIARADVEPVGGSSTRPSGRNAWISEDLCHQPWMNPEPMRAGTAPQQRLQVFDAGPFRVRQLGQKPAKSVSGAAISGSWLRATWVGQHREHHPGQRWAKRSAGRRAPSGASFDLRRVKQRPGRPRPPPPSSRRQAAGGPAAATPSAGRQPAPPKASPLPPRSPTLPVREVLCDALRDSSITLPLSEAFCDANTVRSMEKLLNPSPVDELLLESHVLTQSAAPCSMPRLRKAERSL